MKWSRFINAFLAAAVIGQVIQGFASVIIMNRNSVTAPDIFSAFSGTELIGCFIVNLLMGIVLAVVFYFLRKILPGSPVKKGLIFGASIWFLISIAGNVNMYLWSPIEWELEYGKLFKDLVSFLAQGTAISVILSENERYQ